MINIGNSSIGNILVGDTQVDRVYLGTDIVWEYQQPSVKDYLKFTALESGTFTLTIPQYVNTNRFVSVSYSLDNGITWITTQNVSGQSVVVTTPTVAQGGTVLWKGSGMSMSANNNTASFSTFSSTGQFAASGNIMSLLYEDDFEERVSFENDFAFYRLFDSSKITTPPGLPATTMMQYCYSYMFLNCTKLTKAPKLPATTIARRCYKSMFEGCTSLVDIPAILPATIMDENCYDSMFSGCTSLVNAPELPSTTLDNGCYSNMFNDCTSLVTAPELPTTHLEYACYSSMFNGCTSLVTAPALPATTLTTYCYNYMFANCTSLTNAPELPALTLIDDCYRYMFGGCRSLTRIKAMFTTEPSSDYTNNWVIGVSSTGTFIKNSEASWDVRGTNGIPTNWTVETANS